MKRAMNLAEGHAALRAAAGLLPGALGGEFGIDLVEVAAARLGLPLLGHLLLEMDEFGQAARHLVPLIGRPTGAAPGSACRVETEALVGPLCPQDCPTRLGSETSLSWARLVRDDRRFDLTATRFAG